jgi:HAD superfamily hydrolase (TIGR01549 family)
MTLTLLLDLDDTLLGNSLATFLPAYLDSLGKFFSSRFPPDEFVRKLMVGTQAMISNTRPDLTLNQVFSQIFYPSLGIQEADLREGLDRFYREIFPSLRANTIFKPEAVELVNTAISRGYTLCLATNPLFPRTAIQQRLDWAGLQADNFMLIASFEEFHFSKPNPAFFAELLGMLGWPDDPVIMVGDNPINDIRGAQQLEISTYWVHENQNSEPSCHHGEGVLSQFIPWLDAHPQDKYRPAFESPETSQAVLCSTPAVLVRLLADLPPDYWTKKPAPHEWALVEILCHLRDVEGEVNYPRLRSIIENDNPFIKGFDTDLWAEERRYIEQDGPAALEQFMRNRLRILQMMAELDEQNWQRVARHSIFGPTTLTEISAIMAGHDRVHVHQVWETLRQVQLAEPDISAGRKS